MFYNGHPKRSAILAAVADNMRLNGDTWIPSVIEPVINPDED